MMAEVREPDTANHVAADPDSKIAENGDEEALTVDTTQAFAAQRTLLKLPPGVA